jgi:hypothetical protein
MPPTPVLVAATVFAGINDGCNRHPSVWPQLFLQAQMIDATVNALTFLHPACTIGAHACIVFS